MFSKRSYKRNKGKSLICFPSEYVIVDIETTGRSYKYDKIIEIGAIKVKNKKIKDTFSTLINPEVKVDDFIVSLTGINNDMLSNQPTIEKVLPSLHNFLKDHIIVGHNVHFDINFLYDNFYYYHNIILNNDLLDTLRLSRIIFPKQKKHKLSDLANNFNIDISGSHRALADCKITFECLKHLEKYAIENNIDMNNTDFYKRSSKYDGIKLTDIKPNCEYINTNSYFYDKIVVFTGQLNKFYRKEAAQAVVNNGGIIKNTLVMDTDILVVGSYENIKNLNGNKTSKHKKAEKYILEGKDIEIIDEETFCDLIKESNKGDKIC